MVDLRYKLAQRGGGDTMDIVGDDHTFQLVHGNLDFHLFSQHSYHWHLLLLLKNLGFVGVRWTPQLWGSVHTEPYMVCCEAFC